MEWVGAAHNRALDVFRDELRKPGVLSRSICDYLVTFSTSDARVPADRAAARAALRAAARRDVARKALAATELCGRRPAGPSANVARRAWLAAFVPPRWSLTPAATRRFQSGEPSQAARDLYAQIEASIDAAASSGDLAVYLNPILDAAAQLSAEEHATIAATVSVAQSSYEYWEVELPTYIEAFAAEYGPCLDESWLLGYTLADAEYRCVTGGGAQDPGTLREPAAWRGARPGSRFPLLMAVARPGSGGAVPAAQRPTVGQGLKTIGRNDASGAFSGAFGGAFSGGVQGAVLGGLVGGAAASITTAAGLAISAVWGREFR